MSKFDLTFTAVGTEDFVTDYKVTLNGEEMNSLYKKEFIKKILGRVGNFTYDFYDNEVEIYTPSKNKKVFKWEGGYRFNPEKGKDYFFGQIDEIVEKIKEIEEWQFKVTSITTTYKYVYKGEGK